MFCDVDYRYGHYGSFSHEVMVLLENERYICYQIANNPSECGFNKRIANRRLEKVNEMIRIVKELRKTTENPLCY